MSGRWGGHLITQRHPGADCPTEPHHVATTLTEWACSCGRYGVLLTRDDEFTICPASPENEEI